MADPADLGRKVFGIGFHKTGTSSLRAALEILGYRVTGPNGILDPEIAENVHDMAWDLVERYDAFQDNPWPLLYREIDARIPDARFILTVRDPNAWIESLVAHFGSWETPMREWIYGYGSPVGHEAAYLERYERHNADVRAHFRGRSEDLLVMDLARGDGWDELCSFLGLERPDGPFPRVNTADQREEAIRLLRERRALSRERRRDEGDS